MKNSEKLDHVRHYLWIITGQVSFLTVLTISHLFNCGGFH